MKGRQGIRYIVQWGAENGVCVKVKQPDYVNPEGRTYFSLVLAFGNVWNIQAPKDLLKDHYE